MKILIAPLWFFLMAVSPRLQAQSPAAQFYNLSASNGLSGDVTHCIYQDKNGFIWIGTQRGLDRFDGYTFRHYVYNPHNTNSILGNQVYKMQQDKQGLIWLVTNKGLNSLHPVDERITRYQVYNKNIAVAMNDLVFVNDSIMLINASNMLYRFNTRSHAFAEIKLPFLNYSINMFRRFFIKNKQGSFFISTGEDLLSIDHINNMATVCNPADVIPGLPPSFTKINQVYFDAAGNTWCFGKTDVAVINAGMPGLIEYPYKNNNPNVPENIIAGFWEEPGKKLWIGTGAGLVVYDYVKKAFYRYRKQPGNKVSLSNNRITGIIKDKNGLYWMSTYGNGICSLNEDIQFKNITLDAFSAGESPIVYKFVKMPFNKILIHTLALHDFVINEQNQVENADDNRDLFPLDSVVWLATGKKPELFSEYDKQLLCSLYNAKKYKGSHDHYVSVQDVSVQAISNSKQLFTDAANKLWVLDGNRFFNGAIYVPTNVNQYIFYAVATNNHDVLIATGAGLFVFSLQTMKLKNTYLHDEKDPYSIGSDYIKYLLPEASGNCWIATADAGLDYFDAAANRFYHYTVKDGLPDNCIYMIVPDNKGRLWISTNNGLSCFDTLAKTFTNYDKTDGLVNDEFNSLSAWPGNNGHLYFAGMKGIDYFNPADFSEIKHQPQLYLSLFKVYDSMLPVRSYYHLPTNDNNITIEFTVNDFLNASKIFYRWKLEDVDEGWVIKKGGNSALYNKLPPGSYEFTVQASYNSKNWSKPVIIKLKIATPWYQTWWFFSLLGLIVTAMIVMLVRYRLKQQLKLFTLRNRIQRDLHDDIGATLSSIKAYAEIIKSSPGNTMIADLINNNASEMIERLEVIIWAANPAHDSMEHFTERIRRFAAPLLNSKKIECKISTGNVIVTAIMPGEVRQHLYLIAKEAINNTAKYSMATSCSITLFMQAGKFVMQIEDDGIGFSSSTEPKGNGLNNMRSRAAQLDGVIQINSVPRKGTSITVRLQYPFKTIYHNSSPRLQ